MTSSAKDTAAPTARGVVVDALSPAAAQFPDITPATLETDALSRPDARLAEAIHRTVLQRWVTLEYLLNRHLRQRLDQLEPALAAILLSAAAQIVLMQRVPSFAAVDEAVALAKARLRKKAGGLVNAVLRKLADEVGEYEPNEPWQLESDQLPLEAGRVRLTDALLPGPEYAKHYLAVATSHSDVLVQHWLDQLGAERTKALCLHGVAHPPTIVAVEDDFDRGEHAEDWVAHERPGFIVWQGSFAALVAFLQAHRARRVQDPAASLAVEATRALSIESALDLCAGRGTKTRQLAALHPQARLTATDVNEQRVADLRELAKTHERITPIAFDRLPSDGSERYDLVLLDVPCSNTGVLARRPEARYRFSAKKRAELIDRQRRIIQHALPLVRPGGCLLYTTCSIDPAENNQQTDFIERTSAGEVIAEDRWLPAGAGPSYHDGSYHALIRMPGPREDGPCHPDREKHGRGHLARSAWMGYH